MSDLDELESLYTDLSSNPESRVRVSTKLIRAGRKYHQQSLAHQNINRGRTVWYRSSHKPITLAKSALPLHSDGLPHNTGEGE